MADYYEGGFSTDYNYDNQNGGGFEATQGSQKSAQRLLLTPVTVKMVHDATQPAPDGDFKYQNLDLNMVNIVGVLRKVETVPTAAVLTIDDGTGALDVRLWAGGDSGEVVSEKYIAMQNQYVQVCGRLVMFANKKSVQYADVTLITDHNKVVYHNLHVMAIYAALTGAASTSKPQALFVDQNEPMILRVLKVIKEDAETMLEGVNVQYIMQKLDLSRDVALEHCQTLCDQGTIYSGIDENSYLSV